MKKYIESINNHTNETFIINPNTGEIMDFSNQTIYVQTEEERKRAKEFFTKKEINTTFKNYGKFIWNVYSISQTLFPNLSGSYITRLIFLSTYINYQGYLSDAKNNPLSKNEVKTLLKVSESEFKRFYNKLVSEKIIYHNEGKLYINDNIFKKGSLSPVKLLELSQDEKYVTRIYISAIRKIYDKATIKSHKTLSYLFQIMPYVNRDYNIVCFNPLEKDIEKIKRMSLGEFADIIKYDRSHIARLCNTLFAPTFTIKGKELTAMRYVLDKSLDKSTYSMFINPRVYYAGTKWKEVEILGQF